MKDNNRTGNGKRAAVLAAAFLIYILSAFAESSFAGTYDSLSEALSANAEKGIWPYAKTSEEYKTLGGIKSDFSSPVLLETKYGRRVFSPSGYRESNITLSGGAEKTEKKWTIYNSSGKASDYVIDGTANIAIDISELEKGSGKVTYSNLLYYAPEDENAIDDAQGSYRGYVKVKLVVTLSKWSVRKYRNWRAKDQVPYVVFRKTVQGHPAFSMYNIGVLELKYNYFYQDTGKAFNVTSNATYGDIDCVQGVSTVQPVKMAIARSGSKLGFFSFRFPSSEENHIVFSDNSMENCTAEEGTDEAVPYTFGYAFSGRSESVKFVSNQKDEDGNRAPGSPNGICSYFSTTAASMYTFEAGKPVKSVYTSEENESGETETVEKGEGETLFLSGADKDFTYRIAQEVPAGLSKEYSTFIYSDVLPKCLEYAGGGTVRNSKNEVIGAFTVSAAENDDGTTLVKAEADCSRLNVNEAGDDNSGIENTGEVFTLHIPVRLKSLEAAMAWGTLSGDGKSAVISNSAEVEISDIYSNAYSRRTGEVYVSVGESAETDETAEPEDPVDDEEQGSVKLIKKGEDGELLSGAGFDLYRADGELYMTGLVTGSAESGCEEGEICVDGLPAGSYYFSECTAPEGYVIDSSPLRFSADDGAVQEVTAVNSPEKATVRVTKKISAADFYAEHGDAIFTFCLRADTGRTYYRNVVFRETGEGEINGKEPDEEGYVSADCVFEDISAVSSGEPIEYVLSECDSIRYELDEISDIPEGGALSEDGKSVSFDLLSADGEAEAVFINRKTDWQNYSDAALTVNCFRTGDGTR